MTLVVDRIQGTPPEGTKVYQPRGAALELLYAKEPEVLIEGPSGTGKSRSCLEKLHILAQKYSGIRGAIVRKTRESLTQSTLVTYERKVLPRPDAVKFHYDDQEYRYGNGSVLTVAGMDRESRIMSSEYDIIYVAEATELLESEVEILTTRLRNGVMPYQQLIMDCNPEGPEHWLNQRCLRGTTRRLLSRHEDNPSLTPDYLDKLRSLTGYRYRRLYLGEWVSAEGQFFHEWDPDIHICEPFEIRGPGWIRWVSIDYGYADPFCALWFARNFRDKYHIYIYKEAYGVGLRDEVQAKKIIEASGEDRINVYVADPSIFNSRKEQGRPSIAKVYVKNKVRPLIPGVNDRLLGWQVVRRALAFDLETGTKPRLQIIRGRAPNLVRTIPAMVHDPLDSEDLADKIRSQKTEDHACDCLRYGLVLETMPNQQRLKLRNFVVKEG